jgi:L-alanine-DL-glutamate epimerase-like enolase superfamily enzyme
MYGSRGFRREGEGKGPLEDLWAQINEPEVLAEELLAEGISAMKIWPFDPFALRGTGRFISDADLRTGLEPFRRIREAVGDRIEIMLEGHGYWDITTAKRIARAVEEYRPAWLEDLVLGHDIGQIAELKASTSTPILASELLITRYQYRPLLERRAADIIMVDPTWAGGITESRKIITMAESFGLPVAMHDCTGPFTLLAGVHLALSAPNAIYQEHVRAYIRTWYSELVPTSITIADGHILPPEGAGIGTELLADVFDRPDATVRITRLSDS